MAKINIDTSVAVSSRIRFARNLQGYNFPSIISGSKDELEICNRVSSLFSKLGDYEIIRMNAISQDEKNSLIERYLISKNLASNPFGAVCVGKNNDISVMINEEDHIRQQCIVSGFDLDNALNKLKPLDNILHLNLHFAKDLDFYYTACPSNLGTGMRASVMLFLPALTYTNKIQSVISYANNCGITFRGTLGEGSQTEGFWYQVSNYRTLGNIEGVINGVKIFVSNIIKKETQEREMLYVNYKHEIIDECLRAFGILQNCHLLSYEECLLLVAKVKFGASIGVIKLNNPNVLDDLVVTLRPSTLKFISKNEDNEYIARAEETQRAFNQILNLKKG